MKPSSTTAAAAACRADFGEAYWSLANLKTYRFTDDDSRCMRAAGPATDLGQATATPPFRARQGLEDRGDLPILSHYAHGNALRRAMSG